MHDGEGDVEPCGAVEYAEHAEENDKREETEGSVRRGSDVRVSLLVDLDH